MGSIIGGLYASGMSPDEIQSFLQGLDWDEVLSDATPRRELFFRRKLEDQRYLFEFGVGLGGIKMGTGMAAGQKFNNLLQFITLRASDVTDFDRLPIPFRAVATDLQAGEPYVLARGNLASAMRASMAVPGVFTAMELDGRILVDGGIVNNLPVDVVKAMGADVVIAVDVGADADHVRMEDLKTLPSVLGRTYAVAQRPGQIEAYKRADIGIRPELRGLTASQFHRTAEFVPLGEAAARGKITALEPLGVSAEDYAAFLARQRRANPVKIPVSQVVVTGNQRVSAEIIRGRIQSSAGELVDAKRVTRDLMRVYGLGEFEQVLFKLDPDGKGANILNYAVTEKPSGPNYFKYGLKLQSDFQHDADWGMLLNLTRMSLNPLGAEWRNDLELGSEQHIVSEFYQPLDNRGFLFLAPSLHFDSEAQDLFRDSQRVAEYDVSSYSGQLDLGVQLRQFAELRAGPFWGKGEATVETGASDLPEFDESVAGWRASLAVDRQDRTLFAREGYYFKAETQLARSELGGDRSFDRVSAIFKETHSLADHTVTVGVQAGSGLGDELPGYAQFTLGGPFSFSGLADDQFRGSALGVASLAYRYRLLTLPSALGRAAYVMGRFDTGNVWREEVDTGDLRNGGSLGLCADTKMGPVYLAYGRAEGGYDRFYFSLGTVF